MSKKISQMTEQEFAEFFSAVRERILEDPIKYFVEAPGLINFSPTPAQKVAFKIIFGQELDAITIHEVSEEFTNDEDEFDLKPIFLTEVQLYEFMTGFKYEPGHIERNRINLIVGRRGGKSTLSSIIALFSTLKVNWKPFLTKTPVATVLVLSHSVEFSEEVLDIIRNMVDDSMLLNKLKDATKKNTQKIFHLKIPFLLENGKIQYSRVRIKVGAASKKTTRGSAICTLLCDEIAFWNLAENAAESDVDILRATRPALLQFGIHGTIIKLSSPGIKQGVLYEEWKRRDELKNDFIQFKAPSWVWNTILPREEFKKEWRLDPDGFDTEFRANFVDSISNFILPEFVDLCTNRGVAFLPPSEDPKTRYTAAIDAAFKSDRFAFSVIGHNETRMTQYVLKYWEGSKKNPVRAHEVAKYIRTICLEFGIQEVLGDQYSFQPLREIFEQYGIRLIENVFSPTSKRKIYFGLKRLIHSQQLDLLDVPLLQKEIKELQVEQTPTGQIKIGHPVGGTDDCSDATAVACHGALEKAGSQGINTGMTVGMNSHGVATDKNGRAFTAPSAEMLYNYNGFDGVIDNVHEWTKHPETGKWIKKAELEEEHSLGGTGGDFIF